MARRLPPLNALRSFEAAARHMSFVRAAEELSVTPAAISQQVKALEGHLGQKLFRRHARGLLLTDAGQLLLPGLRQGLDVMAEAVRGVGAASGAGPLTVNALPSFATRWLVPRLSRFHQRHPDIQFRLATSSNLVDFASEDVDAAIRYGKGDYPGVEADLLMAEDLTPVCSPALLDGPLPLSKPSDLRYHTLLHDVILTEGTVDPNWRQWLDHVGLADINPYGGPGYTDASNTLQAAVTGQGIAMGRGALVADAVAGGYLVRPFSQAIPSGYAYFLVYPPALADLPKIRAFRDWLIEEARACDCEEVHCPDTARDSAVWGEDSVAAG